MCTTIKRTLKFSQKSIKLMQKRTSNGLLLLDGRGMTFRSVKFEWCHETSRLALPMTIVGRCKRRRHRNHQGGREQDRLLHL